MAMLNYQMVFDVFLDSRIFFGIIQPSNRNIEVLATTPEKGRAPKSSLA